MKTTLNFEDSNTKELLSKFDFDFFLSQNIEEEKYSKEDTEALYSSYNIALTHLKLRYKGEKKQANYFLEGQVRKMFTGGFLPALFHLDEGRSHTIFDFAGVGHDLAYFKLWQVYYKRKITKQKIWEIVIKVGSLLGIILSIIKLWEVLSKT